MITNHKHKEECNTKTCGDCSCDVRILLLDEVRCELNELDAKKYQDFNKAVLDCFEKQKPICWLVEYGDKWGVDFDAPNSGNGIVFEGKDAEKKAMFITKACNSLSDVELCTNACPFKTFRDE